MNDNNFELVWYYHNGGVASIEYFNTLEEAGCRLEDCYDSTSNVFGRIWDVTKGEFVVVESEYSH